MSGPCQEELDEWCAAVKPGEGRLAKCMTDQLAAEAKAGYTGTRTADKCKKALSDFKIERSENINRDLPLAKACKADAERLCADKFEVEVCPTCTHLPCKPTHASNQPNLVI